MFPQVSDVSSTLKKWFDIISPMKYNARSREQFHICTQVADGRYLKQICCLDNAETDTQATVWADTGSKQVKLQKTEHSKLRLSSQFFPQFDLTIGSDCFQRHREE